MEMTMSSGLPPASMAPWLSSISIAAEPAVSAVGTGHRVRQ